MSRANPRYRRTNPTLPVPTGHVVQLILQGTCDNQVVLNVLHYMSGNETPTTATLGTFVTAWIAANQASYLACLSSDYSLSLYKAQYLDQPSVQTLQSSSGLPAPGTGAAGHAPNQVAALISLYSAVRGQSGRGRVYLPGVPAGAVTNSILSGAQLTAMATLLTKLQTTVVGGAVNYVPVIWSRRNYNKLTGAGGGASPIIQGATNKTVATIRRRRIGRGK